MSPDRLIRTVAGVHGGALVIVGLGYIATGLAWVLSPLVALQKGVSWVPHGAVTQDSVGGVWIVVGFLVLASGLFSKGHKKWETAGYIAAIVWPVLICLWFLGAALIGRGGVWVIALVMVAWPTVFITWIGLRAPDATVTTTRAHATLADDEDTRT